MTSFGSACDGALGNRNTPDGRSRCENICDIYATIAKEVGLVISIEQLALSLDCDVETAVKRCGGYEGKLPPEQGSGGLKLPYATQPSSAKSSKEAQRKKQHKLLTTTMESGTTISFSNGGGYWQTRYSFVPRCYFAVDNDLYSMPVLDVDNTEEAEAGTEGYEGKEPFIWRHNVIEQPRNLFYNTPFKSSLTIVANYNPSMVKAFNAISIESNYNGWSGTFETNVSGPIKRLDNDYQKTTLPSGALQRKEGPLTLACLGLQRTLTQTSCLLEG